MQISNRYVVVSKVEEPKKEGFQTAEVQDSFVCKGRIELMPAETVYVSNHALQIGDIIYFAKYSPDTHEIELPEGKRKFVAREDILGVV